MTYTCSFCGKSQDQVQRLIAGPNRVYICDECVNLCQEIINEEHSNIIEDRSTWRATTRRQADTPGTGDTAQPTPTPCPECQSERIFAETDNGIRVATLGEHSGLPARLTEMRAVVCPTCGYTTFYAKNPENLTK